MSYRNVLSDFAKAKTDGTDQYLLELKEKIAILEFLLDACNDGRRKALYCNAVNLLPLLDLREIMAIIQEKQPVRDLPRKEQAEKIEEIMRLFEARAESRDISLMLRK